MYSSDDSSDSDSGTSFKRGKRSKSDEDETRSSRKDSRNTNDQRTSSSNRRDTSDYKSKSKNSRDDDSRRRSDNTADRRRTHDDDRRRNRDDERKRVYEVDRKRAYDCDRKKHHEIDMKKRQHEDDERKKLYERDSSKIVNKDDRKNRRSPEKHHSSTSSSYDKIQSHKETARPRSRSRERDAARKRHINPSNSVVRRERTKSIDKTVKAVSDVRRKETDDKRKDRDGHAQRSHSNEKRREPKIVDSRKDIRPLEKSSSSSDTKNKDDKNAKHKDRPKEVPQKEQHQPMKEKEKGKEIHRQREEKPIRKRSKTPPAPTAKRHSNNSSSHSRNVSSEKDKHERIKQEEVHHDESSYGPALPPPKVVKVEPKVVKVESKREEKEKRQVGPELPPADFKQHKPTIKRSFAPKLPSNDFVMSEVAVEENFDKFSTEDDDKDEFMIGPCLQEKSQRDLEREKRKIQMQLDELDKRENEIHSIDKKNREEWMLELPEIRKVADGGLGARQFRRNDQPDFSDRGSWTKAPNDGAVEKPRNKADDARNVEKRRHDEQIAKRDTEQEEIARKHKKQHKRDKSLLEIHEKKMKKEKKKMKDEKQERKPFSRETDLQVDRFDEARKKSAIKNSQLLDDRFSRGNQKFL